MSLRYFVVTMRFMLLFLWTPVCAWAASITLDQTIGGLTWMTLALVCALSSLSGATALVWRIEKELRSVPDGKLPRPWLFASAHMLGSWLAGVLSFLIAESQDLNDWAELGLIVAASFMGAKFVEMVAERYLARMLPPPPPGATP